MTGHQFTRPGQVAPGRPAPDACMVCGQPEAVCRYVPPGPIETIPLLGYCQPETRQAAFAAVLAGVPMGTYDHAMISWLVGWDDSTCRTITSIMWRCRVAGPPGQDGAV